MIMTTTSTYWKIAKHTQGLRKYHIKVSHRKYLSSLSHKLLTLYFKCDESSCQFYYQQNQKTKVDEFLKKRELRTDPFARGGIFKLVFSSIRPLVHGPLSLLRYVYCFCCFFVCVCVWSLLNAVTWLDCYLNEIVLKCLFSCF